MISKHEFVDLANILFKEIEANIQEYESLGFFDLIFILAIM
jgi:hypothetical protein